MTPAISDRIAAEIAARRDDLVRLTCDLIRIPTLNPPGRNYHEICELLGERLARSGFVVELLRAEGSPGDSAEFPRWNLMARRPGVRSGQTLHFNGHHDVVTVGHGWTRDPFGGVVEGDRIYGRGACDMKGGIAASVIAAEAFIAACPDYSGSVEISATADEETGGYGGVAWLAERGHFAHVDHVIIPEPLNKDRICLGHRGVWWAEIETKGRIAHGSMPFLGDSAIRHMGALLHEIETRLAPALAEKRTAMPVVPPQARQSSLNVNSIHGGEADLEGSTALPAPVVADRCRIVIDRRFLIEESLSEVKREIADLVAHLGDTRPGFTAEIRNLFEVHPVMAPTDAPIVRATHRAISQVLGLAPDYVVSPGTYDQKHIDRIGKLRNCIAYGPGILDLAHQPDEWIGIGDMLDSAHVMALVMADLLAA